MPTPRVGKENFRGTGNGRVGIFSPNVMKGGHRAQTWRQSAGLVAFGALLGSFFSANVLYFTSRCDSVQEVSGGPKVVSPESLMKKRKHARSGRQLLKPKGEQPPIRKSHGEGAAEVGLKDFEPNHDAVVSKPKREQPPLIRKPTDEGGRKGGPKDFERNPDAVIVTKIHGPKVAAQLIQSLCLLTAAYNSRTLHDIIVFVTEPLEPAIVRELETVVHPASIRVVFDRYTLEDQLRSLSKAKLAYTLERCNVTSFEEMTWRARCCEKDTKGACMPISYAWQAEFRSKHLWLHPFLKPYKYMMWFDSDAFATRVWEQDPVAFAVRNDLVILYDHFPMGRSKVPELQERIQKAYGKSLCFITGGEGHLQAEYDSKNDTNCHLVGIPLIHGFFHVTSLDFYMSEETMRWNKILIGNDRFSRKFDDQVQVTIPAAMRAPERAWDMNSNGVKLDVWHNKQFDGQRTWEGKGYYVKWWEAEGKESFPEAVGKCGEYIINGG